MAVVYTSLDGNGTFAVLQRGETIPSIRAGLRPIHEWELDRPKIDWNKLQGAFDAEGNLLKFVSGTKTDFTMAQLVKDFDRRNLRTDTEADISSYNQSQEADLTPMFND